MAKDTGLPFSPQRGQGTVVLWMISLTEQKSDAIIFSIRSAASSAVSLVLQPSVKNEDHKEPKKREKHVIQVTRESRQADYSKDKRENRGGATNRRNDRSPETRLEPAIGFHLHELFICLGMSGYWPDVTLKPALTPRLNQYSTATVLGP